MGATPTGSEAPVGSTTAGGRSAAVTKTPTKVGRPFESKEDPEAEADRLLREGGHGRLTYGIVVTPKSGHQRAIPIAPPLQPILEEAKKASTSKYVAPSGKGAPWTHGGLRHAFNRALERAKLPHTRLHDLRHFFITQCFVGGAGGPTVQKLAGHCHLSVTQRYAHTTEALMREAVQVFGSKRFG